MSEFGWFAYAPLGSEPAPQEPVTYLRLVDDEHAGPYAGTYDYVGDDLDGVVEGWTIDPALHVDVLAWHERASAQPGRSDLDGTSPLFAEKQALLVRLAADVPAGVAVEAPRAEPRRLIHLRGLVREAGGRLASRPDDLSPRLRRILSPLLWTGPLPTIDAELVEAIEAWIGQAPRFDEVADGDDAAFWVWSDRGDDLVDRLQERLGDDWRVARTP